MRSSKWLPVLGFEFLDLKLVHVQLKVQCQAQEAFLMCPLHHKSGNISPIKANISNLAYEILRGKRNNKHIKKLIRRQSTTFFVHSQTLRIMHEHELIKQNQQAKWPLGPKDIVIYICVLKLPSIPYLI